MPSIYGITEYAILNIAIIIVSQSPDGIKNLMFQFVKKIQAISSCLTFYQRHISVEESKWNLGLF